MLYLVFIWSLFFGHTLISRNIATKTISEFIQDNPETKCVQCTKDYRFHYDPFPLYQEYSASCFPSQGLHRDLSILEIPHGYASINSRGNVLINDVFIKETEIKNMGPKDNEYYEYGYQVKVSGKVAVVTHTVPYIYGHWIFDILGQLALLELHNIEYDYLWIPFDAKFMKETLELWGIDRSKIIPLYLNTTIQADCIILPTSVGQNDILILNHVNYYPDFLMQYVHEKMVNNISKYETSKDLPTKIFVSRKNALRSIPNEDTIFELFRPFGFVSYDLASLPIAQQIVLFHNAEIIVSFVGSGSTNIIFCRPGTRYVEIQQSTVDATFFFLSNIFKLKYDCINGTTYNDLLFGNPYSPGREFPLLLIQDYIQKNSMIL